MRSRLFVFGLIVLSFAVPGYAYRMSAWVPSWDPAAVTTMQMHAGNLSETNPGWYTVAADGSFTRNYKAEDPTMRAALSGTQLVPTIKNFINGKFDGATVATIVADPALREKHAEALTQLTVDQNFSGIDIDYESLPLSARDHFTAFIQLLAAKLHGAQRQLSVTVHAKTAESTRTGPGAQDWRAIGAVADSVKIMVYDKHWSTSEAGAITPLDWLDQVATYAESTIPAGKIIIGLPWYGYDWLANAGTSVTYATAIATAQRTGATITRDVSGEATYTYEGRTVYFQDAEAYRAKVNLIVSKHPAIGGFAHWRVGAEDPDIWPVVRGLTMQAPSIRPAPQDFRVDAPVALQVVAGSQTTAKVRYVSIDGFDAAVSVNVARLDGFDGLALLSSPTVTKSVPATMIVTVPNTTRPGTYRLEVTMTGAGLTRTQIVTVNVSAPASARRRAVR